MGANLLVKASVGFFGRRENKPADVGAPRQPSPFTTFGRLASQETEDAAAS